MENVTDFNCIPRTAHTRLAYTAAKTLLGTTRALLAFTVLYDGAGTSTGADLDERHRKATGESLALHTYLDDLCALGWVRRVGRGISQLTGKSGTLWDITGEIGGLYKAVDPTAAVEPGMPRRPQTNEVVASMIGFTQSRNALGATYHEWWSWYREKQTAVLGPTVTAEYHGTSSARWKELQRVGVLLPTNLRRSQRDAVTDLALKMRVPNKPAQVFVLREGASVMDYINGNKRSSMKDARAQVSADEMAVLQEYRQIKARWLRLSATQRENRVVGFMNVVVRNMPMNTEKSSEATTETHATKH